MAAPIYAVAGYAGVVAFLVCCAAGAATGLWVAARRLTGSASAATLAWLGAAVSAPFVFNSITDLSGDPGGRLRDGRAT